MNSIICTFVGENGGNLGKGDSNRNNMEGKTNPYEGLQGNLYFHAMLFCDETSPFICDHAHKHFSLGTNYILQNEVGVHTYVALSGITNAARFYC